MFGYLVIFMTMTSLAGFWEVKRLEYIVSSLTCIEYIISSLTCIEYNSSLIPFT